MASPPSPTDSARIVADTSEGAARVVQLGGRLTIPNAAQLDRDLAAIVPEPRPLIVDVASCARVDTTGAWLVHRLVRDWAATGQPANVRGATPDVLQLIDRLAVADPKPGPLRPPLRGLRATLQNIGDATISAVAALGGFLDFLGTTLVALARTVPHPRKWRWDPIVYQAESVMVNALGIVGLMSFLVGFVIAQQGAVQLAQFGADVFTINLIGRITMRELGVLMTAIMVAGRSGSAFAAQIGSMKLNEEVDALRTIGLSSFEVLVLPRVLALVLTMPLLAFFAALCALIGGGLYCAISLSIPPVTFVSRVREVVPMTDFYITLIKAPLFAIVIAITGCFQGMQVEGNAESVGHRTTQAVVQSIFLVIVLDAFLAVFFAALGWI